MEANREGHGDLAGWHKSRLGNMRSGEGDEPLPAPTCSSSAMLWFDWQGYAVCSRRVKVMAKK